MIAFAYIDKNGIPVGGGIRREVPPEGVPLTPPFTTADLPRIQFRDGAWEERTDLPVPPPPTREEIAEREAAMLAKARAEAGGRINAQVGMLRKRIYTDIPGQDALYLEKRAEAVTYIAAAREGGEPATLTDFPLLENETGITAPSAWQLAQLWLNRSSQFKRVGAATERLRMRALIALESATDAETIQTIETQFTEALSGLPL